MASSAPMHSSRLFSVVVPFAVALAGCGGSPAPDADSPKASPGKGDDGLAQPPHAVTSAEDDPTLEESEGGQFGNGGLGISGGDGEPEGGSDAGTKTDDARPMAAKVDTPLGGKLSQAEIRKIVLAHGELFDRCYTIGAQGGIQFVAKVEIKAFLGPSGKANKTQVLKSTAKNPKVDECVADAFKQIQFPRPHEGATSVVTFPIEFQGAEQVN